jgi:nicotinamidase-related amidase
MDRLPTNAVLLIIDVQKGLDEPVWGTRNNPHAESNMAKLLQVWRNESRPVVHVQHNSVRATSPLRPGQPGNEIKDEVKPIPGEHLETKTVNSAFIGTTLEQHLRKNGWDTLVIVGLTTDHCISTSVRMAGNLGFKTYVVSDATATHDRTGPNGKHYSADEMHDCALASLNEEFATVISTADVLKAFPLAASLS